MVSFAAVIALQDARVRALLRTPYQPEPRGGRVRQLPELACARPSLSAYSMGCRCEGCRQENAEYRAARRAAGKK